MPWRTTHTGTGRRRSAWAPRAAARGRNSEAGSRRPSRSIWISRSTTGAQPVMKLRAKRSAGPYPEVMSTS